MVPNGRLVVDLRRGPEGPGTLMAHKM